MRSNYIHIMNAAQQAFELVKKRLETGLWQQGERLPSLAEMAEICAVSRSTMWRALRILAGESLVHANRGGAIVAGPAGMPLLRPLPKKRIWERLKVQIGHDIFAGAFAGSGLPLINKLVMHYRVSFVTLKKALNRLADEGVLINLGHRYVLARNRTLRHASGIVFVSLGDAIGAVAINEERTRRVVESLEHECLKQGYECRPVGFNDRSSSGLLELSRTIEDVADVAGFVVNIWIQADETTRKRWFDLCTFLAGRKAPVILIDQAGNLSLPDTLARHPNLRILRIAGSRAGEMAADVLVRSGHRRIAYLAPNFNQDWAQNRYAGLCSHVTQYAGAGAEVKLFALREIADLADLVLELVDLGKDRSRVLFGERYTPGGITVMLKTIARIKRHKLLALSKDDPKLATIRSDARHLAGLAGRTHDAETFNRLLDAMYDRASTYAFEIYLRPFFKRILKNSTASAWVCSDDKTGEAALRYLASHGTKVPGEISVVSFDNWPGSFVSGLSSYDFNMDGIIQQALAMIADEKTLTSRPLISEIDGYVVERRSIRR
jgi:DNA-binding LacI/PurR family transcriptional regulator/DNA-binding transcriptional regulator YhcF (GntR family)